MIKVLFIVVGIALLCASTIVGFAVKRFVAHAASAEGVVVGLHAGGSHPQIEFTTETGQRVSYPQGGFIFGYGAGEKVRVLYRPDNPVQTARIDTAGSLWFVPLLLLVLGIFLLGLGFFMQSVNGVGAPPS